jgi:recombination protein RecT
MSKKADELKNQITQKAEQSNAPATQQQQQPMKPAQKVGHYLKEMMPSITAVSPSHVTPERMSRIALNVIRTNPKLLECDINSLMGGVLEAAKLGLEPGLMGQCYLIPFQKKQNGKVVSVEAQFIIGYKGLIDLVRRSGQVSTIEARTVYQKDVFEFEYGLESKLVHKPAMIDKGEAIAYYAVCKLKDGGSSFLVMSKQEMDQYKDNYAKSKYGPWANEFDAMARKTCLRQLIKYLPISVEHLSNFDERSGVEVHQEVKNADVLDMGEYTPEQQQVDEETGEIK